MAIPEAAELLHQQHEVTKNDAESVSMASAYGPDGCRQPTCYSGGQVSCSHSGSGLQQLL